MFNQKELIGITGEWLFIDMCTEGWKQNGIIGSLPELLAIVIDHFLFLDISPNMILYVPEKLYIWQKWNYRNNFLHVINPPNSGPRYSPNLTVSQGLHLHMLQNSYTHTHYFQQSKQKNKLAFKKNKPAALRRLLEPLVWSSNHHLSLTAQYWNEGKANVCFPEKGNIPTDEK